MAFTYLKVKSAKCLCLLPVVLILIFWSWSCKQRSWSWSCYVGLGLKNLVLLTSLNGSRGCRAREDDWFDGKVNVMSICNTF